jgi:hypothetical protein
LAHEAVEEIVAIAGAGTGLGMVLHGEDVLPRCRDALVGPVEEADMGDPAKLWFWWSRANQSLPDR